MPPQFETGKPIYHWCIPVICFPALDAFCKLIIKSLMLKKPSEIFGKKKKKKENQFCDRPNLL